MQLAAYLDEHDPPLTARAFADQIGVDPSMVTRWCRRETFPKPANLMAIAKATNGRVTANDFFHAIGTEAVRAELERATPDPQVAA